MKKFLLLLVFALGFIAFPRVSADPFLNYKTITVSRSDLILSCSMEEDSGDWAFVCEYDYHDKETERITITTPASALYVTNNTQFQSQIELYNDMGNGPDPVELAEYITIGGGGTFDIWTTSFSGSNMRGIATHVKIIVAYDTIPGAWTLLTFVNGLELEFLTKSVRVIFYDRGDYIEDEFILNSMPTAPADPIPDSGYLFAGWVTSTGEDFNFGGSVLDEWVDETTGTMAIHSTFIQMTGEAPEVDLPDPDVPLFISSPLHTFGADNDTGYMAIYGILTLILVLVCLAVHVPAVGAVVSHLFLTIAFMFMGMLPVFMIVVMILAYVIFFARTLTSPSAGEGE
jgi:hypothetical protein